MFLQLLWIKPAAVNQEAELNEPSVETLADNYVMWRLCDI